MNVWAIALSATLQAVWYYIGNLSPFQFIINSIISEESFVKKLGFPKSAFVGKVIAPFGVLERAIGNSA